MAIIILLAVHSLVVRNPKQTIDQDIVNTYQVLPMPRDMPVSTTENRLDSTNFWVYQVGDV